MNTRSHAVSDGVARTVVTEESHDALIEAMKGRLKRTDGFGVV